MKTTCDTTRPAVRIQAGSPAALVALVPHLLGFIPQTSMVVIGTEPPQGTVKLTLRYDLPDPADHDTAADIAAHTAAVLAAQHLTGAAAVGYGPDILVRPIARALRDAIERADIDLAECLRTDGTRYWSYTCTDPHCCPEQGAEIDITEVVSAVRGDPVLASRDEIAGKLAPVRGTTAESMRQATHQAEQHVKQSMAKARKSRRASTARHMIASEGLAAVADLIQLYRAGGRYASDYQLAWLTVALKDLRVRDDAWARMDPHHRDAHRQMWTDVVRHAQPGYVAAPAALLAFVAWQDGNGVLANIALDRALDDSPGYSMAALLRQALNAGAPPSMARLPLTPEEVAACYDDKDQDDDREPASADDQEEDEPDEPVSDEDAHPTDGS